MSAFGEIEFVDVVDLKALPEHRLWLRFSDGTEGVCDLTAFVFTGGEMVDPLRDQSYFERAFLAQDVPAWPNGLELDATGLHLELGRAGLLKASAAA